MKTEEFKYLPQIIKRISRVLLEVVVSFFFFFWLVSWFEFFYSFPQASVKIWYSSQPTKEGTWSYRSQHGNTEFIMESH